MTVKLHTLIQEAQELSPPEQLELIHVDELGGDFWPEDESVDDFIDYIYQQRREDRCNSLAIRYASGHA